jgi:hypothetical protein
VLPIVAVFVAAITAGIVYFRLHGVHSVSVPSASSAAAAGCGPVAAAFQRHAQAEWLSISGRVSRNLSDSNGKYEHQRFIVTCPSGQTVLIVNDVSIGKRAPVAPGDEVAVHGRYFYNAQGGLIDFTHHDPAGGTGGWILYGGKVYALGQTGVPRKRTSSPLLSTVTPLSRTA